MLEGGSDETHVTAFLLFNDLEVFNFRLITPKREVLVGGVEWIRGVEWVRGVWCVKGVFWA